MPWLSTYKYKNWDRNVLAYLPDPETDVNADDGACGRCREFSINHLRQDELFDYGTLDDIVRAGKQGCGFCGLLRDLISEITTTGGRHRSTSSCILIEGSRAFLTYQARDSRQPRGDIEGLIVNDSVEGSLGELVFSASDDDVATTVIRRRSFIQSYDSDSVYNMIRGWMKDCDEHVLCQKLRSKDTKLPTRLVDVGLELEEPTIHVVAPNQKGRYVALSYCWGIEPQPVVLTKAMLDSKDTVFPMSKLPSTIRDAITITRKLGFRYIWVDALCIIQSGDDGFDFSQECGNMCAVYGNAALTIGAGAADGVQGGIFADGLGPERDLEEVRPIGNLDDNAELLTDTLRHYLRGIFERPPPETPSMQAHVCIPYELPDGSLGSVLVRRAQEPSGPALIKQPLNTRGWTLQERILSSRMLIYYHDMITWDCPTLVTRSKGSLNCEALFEEDNPGRYIDFGTGWDELQLNAPNLKPIIVSMQNLTALKIYWRSIAHFYSKRCLSYPKDKLPALAGLAKQVQDLTGDTYIAGLWKSDLTAQLLWYELEDDTIDFQRPAIIHPPAVQAPSWSWASSSNTINWSSPLLYGDIEYVSGYPENEFGQVPAESYLKLRGQLKDMVDLNMGNMGKINWSGGWNIEMVSSEQIWCLKVIRRSFEGELPQQREVHCLLLRLIEQQTMKFQRVGCIEMHPPSALLFDGVERRVVTLV